MFLVGLAQPVIDISSDSEGLGSDSANSLIRRLFERHMNCNRGSSCVSSNMSRVSNDSNVEPEIDFTTSTTSDAESQRALEAESRFNFWISLGVLGAFNC